MMVLKLGSLVMILSLGTVITSSSIITDLAKYKRGTPR